MQMRLRKYLQGLVPLTQSPTPKILGTLTAKRESSIGALREGSMYEGGALPEDKEDKKEEGWGKGEKQSQEREELPSPLPP